MSAFPLHRRRRQLEIWQPPGIHRELSRRNLRAAADPSVARRCQARPVVDLDAAAGGAERQRSIPWRCCGEPLARRLDLGQIPSTSTTLISTTRTGPYAITRPRV